MPIDPEKLAKLQKASSKKVGGSRVKAKKVNKTSSEDDSKLQAALQKLHPQTLDHIEEANFFKDDGKVLHFNRVGVQAAMEHNTFSFTGYAQEKEITELIPQILPQLGTENLQMLQQLAQQLSLQQQADGGAAGASGEKVEETAGDDIPELTEGEKFDEVE
ncbi:hypothetical protein PACTADRAFT_44642 [Pachysolen tannophilus NRRL Y-2460]|uniref:Nascent polypeptide-associated complex subunit beta n=1 Tax=Pachysolen tannophilus NRRL Y-2460 TaxID=669874 RepID=A0A1E4TR57_PACTA|nr:hypothetical protein PACTADRAFT_44642 [Pachysolen tannophilus NRRL Y-2460]